jgi:hypothetical protein
VQDNIEAQLMYQIKDVVEGNIEAQLLYQIKEAQLLCRIT